MAPEPSYGSPGQLRREENRAFALGAQFIQPYLMYLQTHKRKIKLAPSLRSQRELLAFANVFNTYFKSHHVQHHGESIDGRRVHLYLPSFRLGPSVSPPIWESSSARNLMHHAHVRVHTNAPKSSHYYCMHIAPVDRPSHRD